MIVYVTTQGSKVVREGRHLLVRKDEAVHHTLFVHRLEQLVVAGNVSITPQAFSLLLSEGVDIVFLRFDGRYLGRVAGEEQKNVFLRRRQFELTRDEPFCAEIARQIVRGKLQNLVTVLQRIHRARGAQVAAVHAGRIRELLERLLSGTALEVVRGYEGQAAALYFPALAKGFADELGFRKRVRRPPTDPPNAVLSLLYTCLINRAYAAVRLAGLDPSPGFLHALDYGRLSLPLDLVEEFRPVVVDTLAVALFGLGILKADDFESPSAEEREEDLTHGAEDLDGIDLSGDTLGRMSGDTEAARDLFDLPEQPLDDPHGAPPTARHPVHLTAAAFRRVIEAFEKKLATEFYYPSAERRLNYGEAMIFQAKQLRRVIEGESVEYRPLLLR